MDPLQNNSQNSPNNTPPAPSPTPQVPPPPPVTPPRAEQPNPIMMPPAPTMPEKHSFGPIIGSVIIVIILILGALYFWGQRVNKAPAEQVPAQVQESQLQVEETSAPVSSDEIESIESDLMSENFTDLEASISEIQ